MVRHVFWQVPRLWVLGIIWTLGCPGLRAELPPLLPRALILEDADRTAPRLSPDGTKLAYIASVEGIRNIWVKTLGRGDDRVVTHDSQQGIDSFTWQQDGEKLLFFQDQGGDEASHLFQVDIKKGRVRDLTPFPGVRVSTLIDNPKFPDKVLIHLNARDRRLRDLNRLDGYAVLACRAFHPTEFNCGVDMSGVSDLNAFLTAVPARWTTIRAQWEKRMGKDPEFLKSISPLFHADGIVRLLFISHNANDTRIRQEQADWMAAAVRKNGKEVTYLVFGNAGHMGVGGIASVHKRYAAIEDFLGRILGGRVEPPGADEKWDDLKK